MPSVKWGVLCHVSDVSLTLFRDKAHQFNKNHTFFVDKYFWVMFVSRDHSYKLCNNSVTINRWWCLTSVCQVVTKRSIIRHVKLTTGGGGSPSRGAIYHRKSTIPSETLTPDTGASKTGGRKYVSASQIDHYIRQNIFRWLSDCSDGVIVCFILKYLIRTLPHGLTTLS